MERDQFESIPSADMRHRHPDLFAESGLDFEAECFEEENICLENLNASSVEVASIWVSMANGEQLHLRHFIPVEIPSDTQQHFAPSLGSKSAQSVFMLHGEVECGRVYYDNQGNGLAWHLARQGYEVFVADLGGRGRSLVADTEQSVLTVHQVITEAIPRFLRAAHDNTVLRSDTKFGALKGPDIWVGHGFGAVLLASAWSRLDDEWRGASKMVFVAGRRQLQAKQRLAKLFVTLFCHPLMQKLVNWKNVFPATSLGLGSVDENANWYRSYIKWMHDTQWIDDEDGFDYRAGLECAPLPSILHLAAGKDTVYSNVQDIRNFITELGQHDARLMIMDGIGARQKSSSHLALLLDPAAVDEVFKPLSEWLGGRMAQAFCNLSESDIAGQQDSDHSIKWMAERQADPQTSLAKDRAIYA